MRRCRSTAAGRTGRSRSSIARRRCGWTTTTAGRSGSPAARSTSCRSGRASRCCRKAACSPALAGGWQTGGTFEYQPGSLITFNNNLFYYGNIDDIKKGKPEIALNADGTLDPTKYWFNVENFERDPTKTPTGFQTRAFPFQVDGLRGPGLTYVNMNVVRNFRIGGRRTFQARMDVQNLLNYAAYNNPITDPTNTQLRESDDGGGVGRGDAVLQFRRPGHVLGARTVNSQFPTPNSQ